MRWSVADARTILKLDAGFLMWDIRRFARLDSFPRGRRTVIQFSFSDARRGERVWWLVVDNGVADLCRDDPGLDVDVSVDCTLRALTEIWTGDSDPAAEVAAGRLRVHGAGRNGQRLWHWLGRSMFAATRSNAQCEATSRDREPAEPSSIEASGDSAGRA